ncbi:RNA polymerase sigma factor [Tundrisphaera sp. TA3]|uniref:RNA polymerase sigma factor n=1 Tax=Tundrisphaera sp. TA3 TaxID=3435775 RepID=UPI003EC0DCED
MKTPTAPPTDWTSALDQHERWLRTVVAARLGERQAVDEVMQEVSLALCETRTTPAQTDNPAGWLYRLAIRKALLYRRACGRRAKLVDRYAGRVRIVEGGERDPLAWLLAEERMMLVREALTRLPGRDAEILLLKYTEGWSCRELAEALGQTEAAIVSRLHRARGRLRDALAGSNVIEVRP